MRMGQIIELKRKKAQISGRTVSDFGANNAVFLKKSSQISKILCVE